MNETTTTAAIAAKEQPESAQAAPSARNDWLQASTTERFVFIASIALTIINGLYGSYAAAHSLSGAWGLGLFGLLCNAGALIGYRVLLAESGAKRAFKLGFVLKWLLQIPFALIAAIMLAWLLRPIISVWVAKPEILILGAVITFVFMTILRAFQRDSAA